MSFGDIAARLRKHSDEKAEKETAPRNYEELHLLRARILGVLIRDAREAAGIQPGDLAVQLGVSTETLIAWEFGRAVPSLPQLELLAYALDIPISHFWGTETLLQQAKRHTVDPNEYVLLRGRLIGALLRSAREKANLTIENVAAEMNIPISHIHAYELGQRAVGLPTLTTLAQLYRVSLSYFLEHGNRVGEFLELQEDMKLLAEMPEAMRHFVSSPVNQSYIELAMRLSQMSTNELRGIAEAILNITL